MEMERVVVLVLEGATVELVQRWTASGRLPSFAALLRGGTSGSFSSLLVPYEFPALLSSFTGNWPGEHGCFSLWHVHGSVFGEIPHVISSHEITTPFIWQRPEAAKLRVGIVNLCGTHPPQPVNGYLISYPLYPTLRACFPA